MRNAPFLSALAALVLALTLVACGESPDAHTRVWPRSHAEADDTPADAPFAPGQRRGVGDATATFIPPQLDRDGDYYLEGVSGAAMPGDMDGDGYAELLLWGYRSAQPELVNCEDGCPGFTQVVVHLVYGRPDFGVDGEIVPDATFLGWNINTPLAWVSGAGDLDGDGLADALVSLGGWCEQGNVFPIYGGSRWSGEHELRDAGPLLRETGSCTDFGTAVGVGDLDSDGFDDFVVAASRSGRSYLFYGRAERPSERLSELDADAVFYTEADSAAGLGPAQPAGDVDGDGHADLLLSHAMTTSDTRAHTGRWWLLRGGSRWTGEVRVEDHGTRLNAAMAHGLGDIDGDGIDDLGLTRFPETPSGHVLVGRTEWPSVVEPSDGSLRMSSGPSEVPLPTELVPAGDMNADGQADFLFVDASHGVDGRPTGAVHLFLGPVSSSAPELDLSSATTLLGQGWTWQSEGEPVVWDELGSSSWSLGNGVASGSDLDGDGHDDLAIVARPGADQLTSRGVVYIWRGRS